MDRPRESICRHRPSSSTTLWPSKKRSFLELRQPSSLCYYNNGAVRSSGNQSSPSSSTSRQRFYRSLDNVHLDDIYRYRIHFDRMLAKINQIKLIVCAGCIFHLVNFVFLIKLFENHLKSLLIAIIKKFFSFIDNIGICNYIGFYNDKKIIVISCRIENDSQK